MALTPQNWHMVSWVLDWYRVQTYLLHEHDKESRLRRTAVSRDREHLRPKILSLTELLFHFQGGVDIVEIPGSLE